ncbi:amino acid ABC transporter substrate-binding protein [Thiohalocapsa marina]|uniref:Amino acid ABC transporter substrate-binding protein n=1 Tax=Thiohalocapsa marina TaxID=424902 RepID=A0A5M8FRN9_9GAMM|nr:amino acid ABC transporter substrate-binding protein [Thiohalocapsa marina]KAA6184022.1 amino acid ABC transporter substrate-binding protein [Thiohalocapsa marina]
MFRHIPSEVARRRMPTGLLVRSIIRSPSFSIWTANWPDLDIEIARAPCEAARLEFGLVPTDWPDLLPGLAQRQLDVVVASVSDYLNSRPRSRWRRSRASGLRPAVAVLGSG